MMDGTIRVLLIEDLERVRVALRTMLQSEPEFDVIDEAPDGETALRLATECAPDLILTDLSLPGISGLETIAALRAQQCDAFIVCLTLHGELRAEAEAAGANLFLEKGVCPDVLLAELRTAAARLPRLNPPPLTPPLS